MGPRLITLRSTRDQYGNDKSKWPPAPDPRSLGIKQIPIDPSSHTPTEQKSISFENGRRARVVDIVDKLADYDTHRRNVRAIQRTVKTAHGFEVPPVPPGPKPPAVC